MHSLFLHLYSLHTLSPQDRIKKLSVVLPLIHREFLQTPYKDSFAPGQAADSQEALHALVHLFHQHAKILAPNPSSIERALVDWYRFHENTDSPFLRLFYGQMKQEIHNREKVETSIRYEPFLTLLLEREGEDINLQKSVENWQQLKQMNETIWSQNTILSFPDILSLSYYQSHEKTKFTFSPTLTLQNQIYDFQSMIYYTGGHYFAVVRCGEEWYVVDDQRVTHVEMDFMKQATYLLPVLFFYEKRRSIDL